MALVPPPPSSAPPLPPLPPLPPPPASRSGGVVAGLVLEAFPYLLMSTLSLDRFELVLLFKLLRHKRMHAKENHYSTKSITTKSRRASRRTDTPKQQSEHNCESDSNQHTHTHQSAPAAYAVQLLLGRVDAPERRSAPYGP